MAHGVLASEVEHQAESGVHFDHVPVRQGAGTLGQEAPVDRSFCGIDASCMAVTARSSVESSRAYNASRRAVVLSVLWLSTNLHTASV